MKTVTLTLALLALFVTTAMAQSYDWPYYTAFTTTSGGDIRTNIYWRQSDFGECELPTKNATPISYNSPGDMTICFPFTNTGLSKDCIAHIYSHYDSGTSTWKIEEADIYYFDDNYIYYCGNISLEGSNNMKLDKQIRFPRAMEAGTTLQASFTGESGTYTGTFAVSLYDDNQTFKKSLLPSGESDLTDCITTVTSFTVTHDDMSEVCMDIDLSSGGKGSLQYTEYTKEIDGSDMESRIQSVLKVLDRGTGWPSSTDLTEASVLSTLQGAELPTAIQKVTQKVKNRVAVIPL